MREVFSGLAQLLGIIVLLITLAVSTTALSLWATSSAAQESGGPVQSSAAASQQAPAFAPQ